MGMCPYRRVRENGLRKRQKGRAYYWHMSLRIHEGGSGVVDKEAQERKKHTNVVGMRADDRPI